MAFNWRATSFGLQYPTGCSER